MAKDQQNIGVNQNILNIITPAAMEFAKNRLLMGDNFGKCFAVTKYPANPEYGWLAKIAQIEGATTKIEFSPTESGALIERCNEQIRELRNDLTTVKDESIRQAKEKGIEDIRSMIAKINQDGEIVGYVTVVVLIQANTEKKLDERVKKVNSIIASFGGSTRVLVMKQKDALKWVSPYGLHDDHISDIASRNMPLSTFIGGFVNSASGINDGTGYLIGSSEDRKPILIDTWKRGGDRTNSNWIITGIPGVGKSATIKHIIFMEYALGAKVIFLDPEREYVDMVKNLGGKLLNCGGGNGGIINIFQVRPAPKIDSEEGNDEFFKNEGHGTSDVAMHFQTIRSFIKLYIKNINDLEIARFEEILEKTYKRFHITWDTDVSDLKPTDFPIFSDVYEDILAELKHDPDDDVLKKLGSYFRSAAMGADQHVFNGHTNVDFDSDIIDIDISSLLEADENILRAQFHNINSFVWQQIAADRNEKILYVIDEGYLIVDPDNPQALIFVKNVAKRIRKYNGGLMFVTHSVVDVLDPAVKRHGQAIIDSACYKFLMGTDGKNLAETIDLFDLTENERTLLLSKTRGRGILFAGSSRISMRVEIPEAFLKLMGSAGGK